ncbi:MAG: zinc-binding alcohol dehydrogenase [Planctomycetaceae bacterium]|nr:zinc-binding alcohol dehydrogenase [Planctomycetaceae bacterium]
MPKRLICTAKKTLAWEDYELTEPTGDQVLLVSEFAAAKHGTEMSCFKGVMYDRGHFDGEMAVWMPGAEGWCSFPVGVGNMIVARVEKTGPDVKTLAVGDKVCFHCCFQPSIVLPEGAVRKMPAGLGWKSAVCLDPAVFAFSAVRDGHVRVGDTVAVYGMGAIGLMVIQIARLAGASKVIAIEPLANRRAVAKELGADLVLDPNACDAGLEVKKATDKRGADVTIDYSGDVKAMHDALRGAAYGGNVVAGAMPSAYGAGLDFGAEAHFNVPNIIFSRACSQPDRDHPRWSERRITETCWQWIAQGRINGEPVVQPVVAYDELINEYPLIATNPERSVKLGAKF